MRSIPFYSQFLMANASPRLKKKRAPPPIPMKREPSPPSPADTSPADGSPTEQIADDDNDVLSPMSVLSPEDESTEDENENDFSEEEQTKPEEEEQTEPEEEEQIEPEEEEEIEPEEEEPPKPKSVSSSISCPILVSRNARAVSPNAFYL